MGDCRRAGRCRGAQKVLEKTSGWVGRRAGGLAAYA